LISNFSRVLNVVFSLLVDSPASAFCVDVSEHSVSAIFIGVVPDYITYEDGTGKVLRNIGTENSDSLELPKRKSTTIY